MIIEITKENARHLFEARRIIDKITETESLVKEVRKYSTRSDCHAYVFLYGGKPIAYVECKLTEEDLPQGVEGLPYLLELGHIARIGVRKDHRGAGIGRNLIQMAEAWLRSKKKTGAWLDYRAENLGLNTFYHQTGYNNVISVQDPKDEARRRKISVKKWEFTPEEMRAA
jgi:GNAT superfamily N-acetyltransferase